MHVLSLTIMWQKSKTFLMLFFDALYPLNVSPKSQLSSIILLSPTSLNLCTLKKKKNTIRNITIRADSLGGYLVGILNLFKSHLSHHM